MATVYTKSYLLKCSPHELKMWREAAGGLPLAPWIREVLNEASGNVDRGSRPAVVSSASVFSSRPPWKWVEDEHMPKFRGPDPRPGKKRS